MFNLWSITSTLVFVASFQPNPVAYFVALLLVNYFQLDFVLIGVFVELLTIPALLSVVIYCGYNFWQGVKGEKSQRPIHWIAVGLLLGCMGMLVWGSL
jgi:uncharacterized membrane-anchored protein